MVSLHSLGKLLYPLKVTTRKLEKRVTVTVTGSRQLDSRRVLLTVLLTTPVAHTENNKLVANLVLRRNSA